MQGTPPRAAGRQPGAEDPEEGRECIPPQPAGRWGAESRTPRERGAEQLRTRTRETEKRILQERGSEVLGFLSSRWDR